MAYMLDTDVCIYAMSKQYVRLNQRLERLRAAIAVSSVVVGELCFGAEKSGLSAKNLKELERFLVQVAVVDFDTAAARHYGEIRASLERAGTPIGSNDMLIAAHARSLGMTLVSNNVREFSRVESLAVETWL